MKGRGDEHTAYAPSEYGPPLECRSGQMCSLPSFATTTASYCMDAVVRKYASKDRADQLCAVFLFSAPRFKSLIKLGKQTEVKDAIFGHLTGRLYLFAISREPI